MQKGIEVIKKLLNDKKCVDYGKTQKFSRTLVFEDGHKICVVLSKN